MSFSLKQLKITVKRLPAFEKMIGLGSLLVIIGCLLPWYSDLDAWSSGKIYIGLTGPLYLLGFFIFMLGSLAGFLLFSRVFFNKVWKWMLKESLIDLAISSLIVFFLMIANSVFFHQDFGVNILRKETRFGMFVTFIGAILVGLGGYLYSKQEERNERLSHGKEQSFKPLIDLNERPRTVNQAVKRVIEPEDRDKEETVNLKMNI